MQSLSSKLKLYKPPDKKITSERSLLIKEFLDILNADRKPPYKPLTPARVGMMLAPVKTKDLYSFLSECKYASNFSKYFWWCFKKEKDKRPAPWLKQVK